jgi:hypothetical protein
MFGGETGRRKCATIRLDGLPVAPGNLFSSHWNNSENCRFSGVGNLNRGKRRQSSHPKNGRLGRSAAEIGEAERATASTWPESCHARRVGSTTIFL